MTDPLPFTVADVGAWRRWLDAHEHSSDGVWLVLAKKGTTEPTSLTYAEALDEALCSGWIDGQRRTRDAATYVQRFTPRRARSMWSLRNVDHIARLADAGRLRPRGQVEVDRARSDGRWERAYAGPATAEAPAELTRALDASPVARERFAALSSSARYSILHPLLTAASPETLTARVTRAVASLEEEPASGS
ncbi:YdeI/OmpD-associated family protein [Microbacterium sp. LRZ72]|uniref:YdeI/OmpD-associated family protein n=1 Tax=Microbacterium sp. LRZ72 TaxID=2942481 RepID=UPI0029AA5036|nr:YdeI/OmpD-associated family protein [Microbacterium sp. LRZ72]MDX2376166.1 YdeI/OmpD-associated family protein [Microbacterium sp. LRZ72]